ncbi:MAG: dolichyl-phosphate beta-glucosyltransferase [Acidobacteriota bacterium]
MEPVLSVVIPAYNEANRLGSTLLRISDHLVRKRALYEILVVDDGSRDDTVEIAEGFGEQGVTVLRQPKNRGKGAAVRRGVLASRGSRILLSDADLSTPIEDLERLVPHLASAPLVLGSRSVSSSEITLRQPFYREFMGKTFNRIIRLAGVGGIRDTQCGFKLLDGEIARSLFAELITDGFAFDVELVWLARRAGHEVVEVGVHWHNSPDSRVHPIRDSLAMLREIVRFRLHHRK